MLQDITPIILSYNEADNIGRTLSALAWAKEILVVDSFSTDNTLSICQSYDNVRVVRRAFDSASNQCNFALQQNIQSEWVLSMDADYVVSKALIEEMSSLQPGSEVSGFEISFNYLINGHMLKQSLYPPRLCLYRWQRAHYIQDGHTQRAIVDGLIVRLKEKIKHDDRKPYSRWLASQRRYALMEAEKLKRKNWRTIGWPDRVRLIGLGPFAVVPYTLISKGLLKDGRPGLIYVWQRFIAECYLLSARLGILQKN